MVVLTGVWATIFVKADNSNKKANQKQAPANQPEKKQASEKKAQPKDQTPRLCLLALQRRKKRSKNKKRHTISAELTRGEKRPTQAGKIAAYYLCVKKRKNIEKK